MADSAGTTYPTLRFLGNYTAFGMLLFGAPAAIAVAIVWKVPTHALVSLVAIVIVSGLGVTLGVHRLFSHRSYATSQTVERLLMILACAAGQGSPFSWVATHRKHHRHSDADGDPHSPLTLGGHRLGLLHGLWHSFLTTMRRGDGYDPATIPDLKRRQDFVWIDRHWFAWYLCGLAVPTGIGWLVGGTLYDALIGFLWGGVLRHCVSELIVYSVNSFTHLWGSRPYATEDESRNSLILGVLALGDGWHNNHHAYPYSARHGFYWWQLDLTWNLIWLMERLGLAWRVRRPTLVPLAEMPPEADTTSPPEALGP